MNKIIFTLFFTTLLLSAQAQDFSAYDMNGKKISLSDFKGKVVLVDVWATWCGPCVQEIPHLKELEKAYHNKDLVVMSISIDPATDQQKWVNYVKYNQLPGVQLFGGEGPKSEVTRMHNINSIPRFLLYNKKGELVDSDAPRPSDSALRKKIDKLLTQ